MGNGLLLDSHGLMMAAIKPITSSTVLIPNSRRNSGIINDSYIY